MIGICNLTDISVSENFIKKIVRIVLKTELAGVRFKKKELSIAFINSKEIKKLNKKYKGKDKPTDVLSFSYDDFGEIVICLEEIKKSAKKFNSSFEMELARILIHGILHLLGYDHKNLLQEKKMKKKEEYYLSIIFKKALNKL